MPRVKVNGKLVKSSECRRIKQNLNRYLEALAQSRENHGQMQQVSPTQSPTPLDPIVSPIQSPTTSDPTVSPTESPTTTDPTVSPTQSPTMSDPTVSPTQSPTMSDPTVSPTQSPTMSDPTVSSTKSPMAMIRQLKSASGKSARHKRSRTLETSWTPYVYPEQFRAASTTAGGSQNRNDQTKANSTNEDEDLVPVQLVEQNMFSASTSSAVDHDDSRSASSVPERGGVVARSIGVVAPTDRKLSWYDCLDGFTDEHYLMSKRTFAFVYTGKRLSLSDLLSMVVVRFGIDTRYLVSHVSRGARDIYGCYICCRVATRNMNTSNLVIPGAHMRYIRGAIDVAWLTSLASDVSWTNADCLMQNKKLVMLNELASNEKVALAFVKNRDHAQAGSIEPLVVLVACVACGTAMQKGNAARVLGNLARINADNQSAIAQASGIPPLVALVRSGTAIHKENAAGALCNLAWDNAHNQSAIAQAGGILPLVALVTSGTAMQKYWAAGALSNLACNVDNRIDIAQAGGIEPLVVLVACGTAIHKENAAGALCHLAWDNAHNQSAIAQASGIPPLVALVTSGTALEKYWAAGALCNLACNVDNRIAIAQAGGIPLLVALVRFGTPMQKKYADHALRNLACDNADNQIAIAQAGGILSRVVLTESGTAEQRQSVYLASNADNQSTIRASIGDDNEGDQAVVPVQESLSTQVQIVAEEYASEDDEVPMNIDGGDPSPNNISKEVEHQSPREEETIDLKSNGSVATASSSFNSESKNKTLESHLKEIADLKDILEESGTVIMIMTALEERFEYTVGLKAQVQEIKYLKDLMARGIISHDQFLQFFQRICSKP